MNPKLLAALATALAGALVVVYWPSHPAPRFPTPLTRDEMRALPEAQLVEQTVVALTRRQMRDGYDPAAWSRLDGPARHAWVATTLEPKIAAHGFLFQLITAEPEAPRLSDLRIAYEALGAARLAQHLETACAVEAVSGMQAVAACRDYQRANHATAFARPPGFSDPFAAADTAYAHELRTAGTADLRLRYVHDHLDEIMGWK